MKLRSIGDWKKMGKEDPYYGVLSDEKFRINRITEDDLKEFFSSGEVFVQETKDRLKRFFDSSLAESTVLDFGCGAGRLLFPFAKITTKTVTGLDVSADIIAMARRRMADLGIENLELTTFDGVSLPELPRFDFINSYIVFQHIETSLGFSLLQQLFEKLKVGGIMQVHLTYGHALPYLTYWNFQLRSKVRFYNYLYSLLKNRKAGPELVMQMNRYPPEKLFNLFSSHSNNVHVELTNHGGHLGAIYLLRKDR